MKIMLYGYGNPGRQDDGLGNAFIDRIELWIKEQGLKGIELDSNYQLNIEDAEAISNKDLVVFIDASVEEIEDYCISKVTETSDITYTTHAASPGYIVDLCKKIYGKAPITYLVHIRGYEWDFREGLTEKAVANLKKTINVLKPLLLNPQPMIDETAQLKICN
jgi:hydrogenase maturation protease